MTISEYEDGPWDDDEWDEWDDDADFYADENLLSIDWIGDDDLLLPEHPARFWECRECDGMGCDPYGNECRECGGTGARWELLIKLQTLYHNLRLQINRCWCGKITGVRIGGKWHNLKHKCSPDEIPF